MVTTHTPGPWRVGDWLHVVAADNTRIATIAGSGDANRANATLIAAAPDLLAVLHELRDCAGYWSEYDVPIGIVGRIDAAIAKATGKADQV